MENDLVEIPKSGYSNNRNILEKRCKDEKNSIVVYGIDADAFVLRLQKQRRERHDTFGKYRTQ